MGDAFDFGHLQYPQIGLPLVEPEQWIVIRAEEFGNGLVSKGLKEHSAQLRTINGSGMYTKSNNPAGVLIHDDQDPVGPQGGRFAPEQIYTPEAVFHVAQEGQSRWTAGVVFRAVMSGEDTANHVLVDLDSKSQSNLLGDSGTSPSGIALLHLDNGFNQILTWSCWAGCATAFRGEQQTVLTILHGLVEVQKSRGFQNDC
jgi:hypothetical protein